ncbi:uncharacterized protein LOC121429719 [Lytechinus variegatus]|uniref:uncharacterized protein LOC121429719 n=1 Tax=Lytechinus variegatus TaxID=7654 RepID=UPI001BB29C52|nr:uncharacterized protein LOC121429719 [Lytechinus variegatus]
MSDDIGVGGDYDYIVNTLVVDIRQEISMAKLHFKWLVLLALFTAENTRGQYQAYTVQDIADLQNTVLYEMFDYFYFAQEQQLTTVFERIANIESRLQVVMDALGLHEQEVPDEVDIVRQTEPPTLPPRRRTEPPEPEVTYPPFIQPFPKPNRGNRKPKPRPTPPPPETPEPQPPTRRPRPRPRPRPEPTTRPTTRPTTQPTTTPTTRPTTQPTTTPPTTPPPVPSTCADIYDQGLYSPSQTMYAIDPLQKAKFVYVKCELSETDGSQKMMTVVEHTKMATKKVTGFENRGDFSLEPVYNATLKQLRGITAASESCSQYIEYRCRGASLMGRPPRGGETYGFWVDVNGEEVESWGGAPTNSRMCACGVDGTCEGSGSCNCDANSKTFMTDAGPISDKERLPVMDVRLGDTGGKKETGYIKLGPLRCT